MAMPKEKTSQELLHFDTIAALTPEIFTKLIRRRYNESNWRSHFPPVVKTLSYQRVDQGVLSQVYRVNVDFDDSSDDYNMPNVPAVWIVKLKRPDLDLGWMFECEQAFYNNVAPNLVPDKALASSDTSSSTTSAELPFALATPLSATDSHLIIEYIKDSTCHDLLHGCPSDRAQFLLNAMAAWHAKCWKCPIIAQAADQLISPPGMGQRLHPLQKEYLFAINWRDTLEHLGLLTPGNENEEKYQNNQRNQRLHQFATGLCQKMTPLKLRSIHDKVHCEQWTCVHGDWHIANWLFPTSEASHKKPILVDWAVCGYGNPMVDIVFFMVVSTNESIVTNPHSALEQYYNVLLKYNSSIESTIGFPKLQELFQWALLCQWMILVAYDELCRQIAMAQPDREKRRVQLEHFRNVNRRTLLALQAFNNWDTILATLPVATAEEREEAQTFSRDTPLLM